MILKKKFLHILFFCLGAGLYGQHQLGMRLESRAGLNSVSLNPALMQQQRSKWEIHLLGLGAFFNNNYTYLRNTNLGRIIKSRNDLVVEYQTNNDDPNVFQMDFFEGNKRRFVNVSSFISGPGVSYKISDHQTIGFFSQMKGQAGSNSIPGEYSYYFITNRPFNQSFPVGSFQSGGATWLELGIHYSQTLALYDQRVSIGGNVKYLSGYDLIFLQSNRKYNHTILARNDFSMTGPDFTFGYSPLRSLFSKRQGRGMSLDLGVTHDIITSKDGYRLKIGASVTDLGMMAFNDVRQLSFRSDSNFAVKESYFNRLSSNSTIDDVTDIFIQQVIAGRPGLNTQNKARILTPASLILFADYKVNQNVFINGLIVQPIQAWGAGPVYGGMMALTPRWEHKWYCISLPLSLYQYQKLRYGLAARMGYLTLGTEDLGSIISKRNFNGTDVYAGLKIAFGTPVRKTYRMGKKVKGSEECYPL
jgi:hypothetical protein